MVETPNLKALRAKAAAQHAELSEYEICWRDRQVFLESKGYLLRPRYRPEWRPSWFTDKSRPQHEFEDYWQLPVSRCSNMPCVRTLKLILKVRKHLIDATRLSDGKLVYVKRVKTGDLESTIAIMLSSSDLLSDPRNHCVPILDYFQDQSNAAISYLVMPFLRLSNDPPFETVEDIVDFINQMIEVCVVVHFSRTSLMPSQGLVFIHEHGVAHRYVPSCLHRVDVLP